MSTVTSVTSHFSTANEGFITTLSGTISGGAGTVGLTSTSGLINGSVFVGIIEPGGTKQQVFTGTVDTAGSQITGAVWTRGTNVSHTAGVSIVDYVSGTGHNMTSKGILVGHNQDGSHKAFTESNIVPTAAIQDSAVTTAKIATDSVTATKIDWAATGADGGIWWEELGRTTLSVAGDTLSVSSLPARKYLRILVITIGSGLITQVLRFNNDSSATYASRLSANGGADISAGSSTSIAISSGDTNATSLISYDIYNVASKEKMLQGNAVLTITGAANPPVRVETVGKWANTTDAITRIDLVNTNTGDFAIGSELVVLGHN